MRKEIISDKQGICIMTFFMFGSTLVAASAGQAKKDIWLAILLGLILALPLNMIYCRFHTLFPGKNLFDILHLTLGNILGKIVSIIFIWFSFHLGALVLRNFSEMIFTMSMPETPQLAILACVCVICVMAVKGGIEVLGRWCEIFIFISIPLLTALIILTIPKMEFNNVRPFLYDGIKPVLLGAFGAFSFPFTETIIFTMAFTNLNDSKASSYRIYLIALILGAILILSAALRNVLVLGADQASRYYFPSYVAISRINIADFLQRLELFAAFLFTTSSFVKISCCLLAASKGAAKLFNKQDYRFAVIPISIAMVIFALKVYNNTRAMVDWQVHTWPYYAFPFEVIIPVIIWIIAEVKVKIRTA